MGMYDTVYVHCPDCGALVGFQTKVGRCNLKEYHGDNVPSHIARGVDGETNTCPGCKVDVSIHVQSPIPRVAMVASTPNKEGADRWD